jgi:Fe-S cluster biogenesis protein NfuA
VPAPQNLRVIGDRIEQLLDELRESLDGRDYERVEDLVRLVLDLHGGGLSRILEIVSSSPGSAWDQLVADELVGSLLLVHELHPRSLGERVEAALDQVRPLLAQHAGDVALVELDEAAPAVRIRLLGSCDGCPSSSVTLRSAVERAILDAAPELVAIDVDEPSTPAPTVPVHLGTKPLQPVCPTSTVPS